MDFNNLGPFPNRINSLASGVNISSIPSNISHAPINVTLNSPMIGRIHKAKPGCSACGKKVS